MLLRAFRIVLDAAVQLGAALIRLPREAALALGGPGSGPEPDGAGEPRRLWQAMAIILPIAGLAAWALPKVTIVMSPSIEAWLLREASGVIRLGDLVSFDLSHPLAGPQPVRVTKYALCFPGQRIDWVERPLDVTDRTLPRPVGPVIWNGWYFCDGRLLGISRPIGHDGRRLEHWRPGFTILPPGLIYVGSPHPDGFDSRYYGPIPIARLTRMAKIL